jgi:Fe-S cluster biosynthesis and repair protein YggX
MSETRLVKCKKLGKELPGLAKPPYKNELGKRIYEEVSKEAWDMWIRDSVKYINTYRVDLTSPEGQKFMFDQAEVYFGFKEGKLADTAFVPAKPGEGDDEG